MNGEILTIFFVRFENAQPKSGLMVVTMFVVVVGIVFVVATVMVAFNITITQ